MINVLLPVVENAQGFCEFAKSVSSKNTQIFVGVTEQLSKSMAFRGKNIKLFVFKNGAKKEEILNSLYTKIEQPGKILVARRVLTQNEFSSLANTNSDIAVLQKKQNKVARFFKNLASAIIRKIFAFNFFDDISAICFNENLFNLLCVCHNFSMASRLNKFVGVNIEYVSAEEKPVKKELNRAKEYSIFAAASLFMVGSFAGAITMFCLLAMPILAAILLVFWMAVALIMWLVVLVNFLRAITVGNLRFGRAEEIETAQTKPKENKKKER